MKDKDSVYVLLYVYVYTNIKYICTSNFSAVCLGIISVFRL